jgi:hypothetical protein
VVLSRSCDDDLFGPAFAELEAVLASGHPIGEHPPPEVLRAYIGRTLEEELVSIVSFHVLVCKDCQREVWRERMKKPRWRVFPEDRQLGLLALDQRATLVYAAVSLLLVVGLAWAFLSGSFDPGSWALTSGGGANYPPPRPM